MFTQEKCESDPGFLSKTLLHGCRSTPGNLAGILIMLLNISQRKDMIFKMIKLLCISVTLKEGSLKGPCPDITSCTVPFKCGLRVFANDNQKHLLLQRSHGSDELNNLSLSF